MSESLSYAVGRIRAKEAFLLDGETLLRAASAKDFETAFAVLSENRHWSERIQKLERSFDFDLLLDREISWLTSLMGELCPDSPEIKVLLSRYAGRLSGEEYLSSMRRTGKLTKSKIFRDLAAAKQIFHEIKWMFFDKKTSSEIVEKKYAFSDLAKQIGRGIEEVKRSGGLSQLEKEEDDFCMGIVKTAKYEAFGIDPLLGFFFAKETEIKNLRLIMSSKKLGQPFESIRPMLRMSYV